MMSRIVKEMLKTLAEIERMNYGRLTQRTHTLHPDDWAEIRKDWPLPIVIGQCNGQHELMGIRIVLDKNADRL